MFTGPLSRVWGPFVRLVPRDNARESIHNSSIISTFVPAAGGRGRHLVSSPAPADYHNGCQTCWRRAPLHAPVSYRSPAANSMNRSPPLLPSLPPHPAGPPSSPALPLTPGQEGSGHSVPVIIIHLPTVAQHNRGLSGTKRFKHSSQNCGIISSLRYKFLLA